MIAINTTKTACATGSCAHTANVLTVMTTGAVFTFRTRALCTGCADIVATAAAHAGAVFQAAPLATVAA
jgi:hypothetical protein